LSDVQVIARYKYISCNRKLLWRDFYHPRGWSDCDFEWEWNRICYRSPGFI